MKVLGCHLQCLEVEIAYCSKVPTEQIFGCCMKTERKILQLRSYQNVGCYFLKLIYTTTWLPTGSCYQFLKLFWFDHFPKDKYQN